MDNQKHLLFLFIICLANIVSCKKVGCEQTNTVDKNLGNTYLDSSNNVWTPKENGHVIFKNKAGAEIQFVVSHASFIDKNLLFSNNAFNAELCERAGYVYSNEEQVQIGFQSLTMTIKFRMDRIKRIPYPLSDTTTIEMLRKYPEKILLRTIDEVATFYIQDSEMYFIGDTLLNDSIYSSVYRINFNGDKSTKCFYLKKNMGLIAVAFTNGEIFSRK